MAALLYGFHQLQDLLQQQIIQLDRGLLMSAIQMSTEDHNKQINDLLALFSTDTEQYKIRYQSAIATKNQPLDENGRTKPIKLGLPYDTAFPIHTSGNAWGLNFVMAAKITVERLNDLTAVMYEGDARYNRDCILAALFNSTNNGRTFQDPNFGALSIVGLANGDATLYIINGADAPATDNHYLAQAGAIADNANIYSTVFDELMEHPENTGGEIVTFIASSLVATTEALSTFVPVGDPRIILGANTPKLDDQVNMFATSLAGPSVNLPASCRVRGRVNKQWIVEWPVLPADYGISIVVGVDQPVLRRRQDPEAQLQGFRPVAERADFPYFEEQWFRRCGFGGWNRVRAASFRIGNGAWAIPTGYDTFEP